MEQVALVTNQLVVVMNARKEVPLLMQSGPQVEERDDVCYMNQSGNWALVLYAPQGSNVNNQGRYQYSQGSRDNKRGGNYYHPNNKNLPNLSLAILTTFLNHHRALP